MRKVMLFLCLFLVCVTPTMANDNDAKGKIKWENWSDEVFERAKRENKFVILDLEAVWCHWCHVMEEKTYSNAAVIELINSRYIAVKVDQDSRPDLSNRYEDYGWPATIFFNSNGQEIVKRSGYIPPDEMVSVLKAIIKDPTPGPSARPEAEIKFNNAAALTPLLRKAMNTRFVRQYDFKNGGWGFSHKFLNWDCVEYAMARAKSGDARAEKMARQTLEQQLNLIDPVWGGVYQYSTGGNWKEPHFEKIMSTQAENLRIYALAYQLWNEPVHLETAKKIHNYLKTFLMNEAGAFYTSQDADVVQGEHSDEYFKLSDAERRKIGIPVIDKHVYARENGWVIYALTCLYNATGDVQYLEDARRAARWIIDNRGLPGGGFRHDEKDPAGPYLGDTLSMGRAFLGLYISTGERQWLARAEEAANFINENFKDSVAGFATARALEGGFRVKPQRDENIMLVRFNNLLSRYSGKEQYKQMAEYAMKYLAAPAIAKRLPTAGVLLADLELTTEPVHITIVGAKDDPQALTLHRAAIKYPNTYLRIEWWDKREGPLPNADVEYPEMQKAAAFACANKRCSLPAFKPEDVFARVDRLYGEKKSENKGLAENRKPRKKRNIH